MKKKSFGEINLFAFFFPRKLSASGCTFTMSATEQEDKYPSPDVMVAGGSDQSSEYSKKNDNGIVLIPQPSDDPEDPLVCEMILDPGIPYRDAPL